MVTEPVLQPRSKTVPEGRAPQLPRRLAAEVSGITNWAIEGLARLRGNGSFTIPAKMAATLNQYRRENSKTLGFYRTELFSIDPSTPVPCRGRGQW